MATMERKTAPARRTDPGTSHLAAAEVGPKVTTVRSRVSAILDVNASGLTHDGLIAEYRRHSQRLGWPPASDSSIRTRCNELMRDGLAERVPETLGWSRFGRPALVWRAVSVQNTETGGQNGETR